jgi:hypothetical protein
VRTKNV